MLLVSKSEWSLNWDENLRFLIKKNLFDDSCPEFSPFLKISAQWTLAVSAQVELDQKKYRRKESDSLVRLKMLFSWWVLCITFHCPHSCASSYCNLLHWVSLLKSTYAWGKKWITVNLPHFQSLCRKAGNKTTSGNVLLSALVLFRCLVANLYFWLSEANIPVIHLASLKPQTSI